MVKLLWLTTLLLIVGFGALEGLWTDRWSLFQGPEQASAKLAAVPRTFGAWQSQDQELDARQVARAEITGYVMRQYRHAGSGVAVQVLLVCGRPGPTSVHTPEVCYGGAGYSMVDSPAPQVVKSSALPAPAEFQMARFEKTGPNPEALRIYWSWNATGAWAAPENPRWTFARHRFLYKLYVIRSLSRPDEPLTDDPIPGFLSEFLRELHKALFMDAPGSASAACRPCGPQLCAGRWSC